jgi:hypothetical protein
MSFTLTGIKSIVIPEDKLEVLYKVLESKRLMETTKEAIIKKLASGTCCICRGIPAFEVTYDEGDGATRIERYCGPCRDKTFSRSLE